MSQPTKSQQMGLTFANTKAPSDYVILNPCNSFPTRSLTVELWWKTDAQNAGTPISYSTQSNDNSFLLYDYCSLHPYVGRQNTNSHIAFNDGQWHHCATTWESSTGQVTIYKDGRPEFSARLSKGETIPKGGALILGQEQDSLAGGFDVKQAFRGQIAEVRMWDKIRTTEEIQENMHQCLTGDESGLVLYWPLDEGTGTQAKDKTRHGNHGTIHGATWQTSDLQLTPVRSEVSVNQPTTLQQSELMFDGIDDYVSLPISSIPEGQEITISFWAKGGSSQPKNNSVFYAGMLSNSSRRIVNIHLPWNRDIWWDCGSDLNSNNPDNHNRVGKAAEATDLKNRWVHWAFTLNANSGHMVIYINGESWCEGYNQTRSISQVGNVKLGDGYACYHGSLSDVRVWDRALTAAEIKQTMSSRLTGQEPGLVSYWPLDEGTGTQVTDKTGHGNHGTIHGATWHTSDLQLTPVRSAPAKLVITNIAYQSEVKKVQSAEYIEIKNRGNGAVNLWGWKVTSEGKNQEFVFPSGASLVPGQTFRVYTNEVHQESGGFSFGSQTGIWNDKADTGKLLDAQGNEMSSYSYQN